MFQPDRGCPDGAKHQNIKPITTSLDNCVTKETKQVEREQDTLNLYFSSSSMLCQVAFFCHCFGCLNAQLGSRTLQVISYLQQWSVLRRLLLHLLQQPSDLFPQFCLQLWLDNVGQCSWKRWAQRVNMALAPQEKELETKIKTLSNETSCNFELAVSTKFKKNLKGVMGGQP